MLKNKIIILSIAVFILTGGIACEKILPGVPAAGEILDGPVEGLTPEQNNIFLRGDAAFNDEIFTPETGLGPLFVATSCGTCHAGDGKGHPFTTLTRFGQTDSTGNHYMQMGGPQLQHRAIPGYQPEQIPAGTSYSNFTPPANTGLGLLEAVPDATLLALADENDTNRDGISGRANWVSVPSYAALRSNAVERNGKYIGRFGKKAAVYNLLQQTVGAYNQDMGIISTYEPVDTYTGQRMDAEVSDKTVSDVVFYLQTLRAPIQRNQNDAGVKQGKEIFINTGCGKCHILQLQTGESSIAALSNQTIFPYTDLLLHDMGNELDDGYTEGGAKTSEWRTPALWGLGLSKNSQGGQYFLMHDGRAGSIEEAVLLHGGEAQQVKLNYQQLTSEEKNMVTKFLESL
jgi:CxxC motif-containing protein (DUF1111 family)